MTKPQRSVLLACAAGILALAIAVVGAGSAALAVSLTWSDPVDFTTATASNPAQVAADPLGLATIVWVRNNGTSRVVLATTSQSGGTYSSVTQVSLNGGDAEDQRITTSASGLATVVWVRFNGSNYIVQASRSQSGGPWSTPENLSLPGSDATAPQIATSAGGAVTVVWYHADGIHSIVEASRSQGTGGWSAPETVSTLGTNALDPHVAVSPTGVSTVVWFRSDGSTGVVQSSTSRPAGGWSSPAAVSNTGNDWTSPRIAVSPTGLATVAWSRSNGTNTIIQSSASWNGAIWSTPADLSLPGGDASGQQLVVSTDGQVTVVWSCFDGTRHIIQASTANNGLAFGVPTDLSSAPFDSRDPHLAVSPTGLVVVIWKASGFVQTSMAQDGGAFSAPLTVAPGILSSATNVAVDGFGLMTAAWMSTQPGNVVQASTFQGAVVIRPPVIVPTPQPGPGSSAAGVGSDAATLAATGTDMSALLAAAGIALLLLVAGVGVTGLVTRRD